MYCVSVFFWILCNDDKQPMLLYKHSKLLYILFFIILYMYNYRNLHFVKEQALILSNYIEVIQLLYILANNISTTKALGLVKHPRTYSKLNQWLLIIISHIIKVN